MAIPSTTGAVGVYVFVPNLAAQVLQATAAGLQIPASGFGGLGGVAAPAGPTANNGAAFANVGAQAIALALSALSRVPVLLGTGQRGPRIKIRRAFSRVYNDITGSEIQFDLIAAGSEALIFVDLTRWNETIYQILAGQPNLGGPAGAVAAGGIGTLMMTEGKSFPVALRFPNSDFHPVFRANGMPAGYRFLSCVLDGDDDYETGSAANIRHLSIHATQVYDPRSNGLALADFNMAGVPALLPN